MRKFIVNIIVFFALVAVIDVAVGFAGDFLKEKSKYGVLRTFEELVEESNHDVLVLGSSRARHHYDSPFLSEVLDLDVYNAGYKGNGILLAYGILAKVLSHSAPKIVIYDLEPAFDIYIHPSDNNSTRYLANLKPYYRDSLIVDLYRDISKKEWLKAHSGMFRYNTLILSQAINYFVGKEEHLKGFEPAYGVYEAKGNVVEDNYSMKPDALKLKYIGKLIELCKSHNVPIIFVTSPKYGHNDSSVFAPVRKICQDNGVVFIDYYTDERFSDRKDLFSDRQHLNADGARVFSGMISDTLKFFIGNSSGILR